MSKEKDRSDSAKQSANRFLEFIKKKPVIISVCAGVAVMIVVAVVVLILANNGNSNNSMQVKLESKIKEMYFLELTTEESEEYTLYELQEDGSYAEVTYEDPIEDLNNLILSKMTYEVVEVNEEDCKVVVVAPDYRKLFCSVCDMDPETLELSDDDAEAIDIVGCMIERIEEGDFEYIENTVTIPVVNGEPQITEELNDAFFGNMYSFSDELLASYLED